jgi:hypothetical protein
MEKWPSHDSRYGRIAKTVMTAEESLPLAIQWNMRAGK